MRRFRVCSVCLVAMLAAMIFACSPASAEMSQMINPHVLQQNLNVFKITTETLPDATEDTPYKAQMEASYGTVPYSWSVDGTLPPGLNIDDSGLIYGTPTESGEYTFTVIVSDSSAAALTREKSFTLSVSDKLLRVVEVKPLFFPAAPSNLQAVFGPVSPTTSLTWQDNSSNETGFEVWRKAEGAGDYQLLMKTGANVTKENDRGGSGLPGEGPYLDVMVQLPNTTFSYKVRAYNGFGFSAFSNESSFTTPKMPADVSNLKAKVLSDTSVQLSWQDNSNNETGFKLHRGPKLQEPPDNWGQFCKDYKLAANTTECTDTGLVSGKTYIYTVYAYNPYQSNICNTVSVEATPGGYPRFKLIKGTPLTIKLHLDNPNMEINGVSQEIDPGRGIAPVIVDGRLMLPARALIEKMGGSLIWDESEKKVVIENGNTKVELWIGSQITKVNGVEKLTDVPPALINSRTMLPLRYVTENLGCTVCWDEITKEAVVEYTNE